MSEFFASSSQSKAFFAFLSAPAISEIFRIGGSLGGGDLSSAPSYTAVRAIRLTLEHMETCKAPNRLEVLAATKLALRPLFTAPVNPTDHHAVILELIRLFRLSKYQIAPLSQILPLMVKWMTTLKINSFSFYTADADEHCLSLNLAPLLDETVIHITDQIASSPGDTGLLLSCILPALTKEDTLSPLICAFLPPLLSTSKAAIWSMQREQIEQLLPAVLSLPLTPNLTAWAMQVLDRYKHMVCEEQNTHGDYLRVFERWKVVAERMVTVVAQSLVLRNTRSGAVQLVFKLLGVLQSIARPFVGLTPLLFDSLKRYLAELEFTSTPEFKAVPSSGLQSPLPIATAFSFAILQEKTLFDLTQLPTSELPPDHISTPPASTDPELPALTRQLTQYLTSYMELHEGHSDLFPEIKAFIASTSATLIKANPAITPVEVDLKLDAWNFVATASTSSNKSAKDNDNEIDLTEQYSVMSMADVYASPDQLKELKEAKIRGLLNLGNTCYLNSVLQLLYHTTHFRNRIFSILSGIESDFMATQAKNGRTGAAAMISKVNPIAPAMPTHRELAVMFGAMMTSTKSSVSTHGLRTVLPTWLRGYEQHDANEFERTLLDAVDREWIDHAKKAKSEPSNPPGSNSSSMEGIEATSGESVPVAANAPLSPSSVVDECFGGKLGTYVRCLECETVSERVDPIADLTLPFPEEWASTKDPHSIDELLEHYFKVDNFGGQAEYFCEKCNHKVLAEKVERILSPPRHLIVLVGRFAYDPKEKNRKKLSTSILFEESQTVPMRLQSETTTWNAVLEMVPAFYSLFGCVVHHGPSPRSGHYVSYARDSEEAAKMAESESPSPSSKLGSWHCFNDNQVSEMSFNKVLQGGAGSNSGQVYILYYIRTDPPRDHPGPESSDVPSSYVLKRVKEADAAASQAADGSRSSRAALRTARTLGNSSTLSRYTRDDRNDGPGSAMGGDFGGSRWIS